MTTTTFAGGAIVTRYLPPTDCRGSRVVAVAGKNHRLIIGWDNALDALGNHETAARELARRMMYTAPTHVLDLPDSERGSYAFFGHKPKREEK